MAKSSTGKATVFEVDIKKSRLEPNAWKVYGTTKNFKGAMLWEILGHGRLILEEEFSGIRLIMLKPHKITDSSSNRLFAFTMALKDLESHELNFPYPKGFSFEGTRMTIFEVPFVFDDIVELVRVPHRNFTLNRKPFEDVF